MNKLEELNATFDEKAVGIYPFVSKHRVNILQKGFHKKDKANYRGVSMMYDNDQAKLKVLLIGYYDVPEDYVIVPEGLEITPGKQKLIDSYTKKGFTLLTKFPSLKPLEFEETSEEYLIAKEVYDNYKTDTGR